MMTHGSRADGTLTPGITPPLVSVTLPYTSPGN
jgi:hypothetical protein